MGGSTTTLTLTAILCLGLCQGPQDLVQTRVLPKPSIWAEPGPMVTKGSSVTIWCQGALQAEAYSLFKEHSSQALDTKIPQTSSNKTGFFINSMSSHAAGRYQCAYYTSRNMWSALSDPLTLVITGMYSAPSLSAQPSPVVASGGKVSLVCSSQSTWGAFHLLKDGGADPPRHMESRNYYYKMWQNWAQASFSVGPVNTSHGGTYRCYGSSSSSRYEWSHPSSPLHLQVTGVYREPTLSAQPGALVLPGDNLTLQCHSKTGFDKFALTKDTHPQRLEGQHSPDFNLGRVTHNHRGRYRCYGGHNLSYAWSAPSAPLDILIAGTYKKPSLSAQPGPSVSWGENVTLQCRSEIWFDTFHLHKEGSPAPPQRLHLQDRTAPFQGNFTMSHVTSAHGGTYRCYGSYSTFPYLSSHPSDGLQLVVSGSTTMEPAPQKGLLNVLIGVSVAIVLLLSLLLFLFFRHWCQGKNRTSVAAASEPKDRGLQKSSRPAADVQEEDLYAVVKNTQPEDRQLDSQTASEDPQDVTYAQLNHLTLRRETSALPLSPSEEHSEPSVYTALAIH